MAELSKKYGVHPTQIGTWKRAAGRHSIYAAVIKWAKAVLFAQLRVVSGGKSHPAENFRLLDWSIRKASGLLSFDHAKRWWSVS